MARRELRDDEVIQVGDQFVRGPDSWGGCYGIGAAFATAKPIGMTVGERRAEIGAGDGFRVFRDEPDEPAGDPGTIDLPVGTVIEAGDQYWDPYDKAWVASSAYNFGKRVGDPGTRAYDTGKPFRYRRLLPKPKYPNVTRFMRKDEFFRQEYSATEEEAFGGRKGDPVAWAPPTREELENARRELSKPTPTVPPYSTSAPCVICGRTDADLVFVANRAGKVCPTHTRLERVKAGLEPDPYLEGRTRWKANSGRAEPYVISGTGPAETRSALGRVQDLSKPPLTILGPDASGDDIAADAESPYWKTKR